APTTPVWASDEDSYSAPDRSVTLDPESRARLGIVAAAAAAKPINAEVRGLGQVLGLDALAQTDADLSVAEAAAHASQAALIRARGMFAAAAGVSRQVLEAAEHQGATDAAQLALAQRKSIATWGRDAPWRDAGQRRALISKIAAGEISVVRAIFPANIIDPAAPPVLRIEPLTGVAPDKALIAKTVWSGPADPAVPGRAYYMLVENAGILAEGDHVRVIAATGAAKEGAYVPAGAVIIAEGATWLYIEEKAGYFVRQAVDISQPSGEGYILLHGVQPGEKVVTKGAGHLLARETGGAE
ncbi:MAG: hypothetical protein ACYCZX_07550, partial [Rhodospirillaceae bacterium]